MSEELRPCPFCGGEAQVNTWTLHGITESRCFCSNSDCPNSVRTVALEQWNTRPIEDSLNARIAELESAQRWIPVGERLPEDGVEVFVLVDGCATNGVHCADGHRYLNEQNELVEKPAWEVGLDGETYTGNMYKNITHWMSIPELSEVQK